MADLSQQLENMGSLLNISGVPSQVQTSQHVVASLAPALSLLNFTEIVMQEIDFDFIGKGVVFTNTDFADPNFAGDTDITKIAPLFNLLTIPPSNDSSGVQGLIGKIKGMMPVAVPQEAAPDISVTWKVTDDDGNELVEGTDFLAPSGLTNPTLDIVFIVEFTEFDGSSPPPVGRKIVAEVTLTAGTNSWTGDVGPVRVLVPAIPFPKVLAMSEHKNFQGAALIVVPGNSAINTVQQIRTLLQPVRNALDTLTTVARFAEMIIGIDTLSSVLVATNIAFTKQTRIGNLNDIDLYSGFWNDTEAEDELSSLVYLSPPPPRDSLVNSIAFCNERWMKNGDGKFTLATGLAFVALINDLHKENPTVSPSNASIIYNTNPPDGVFSPSTFGDELSSLEFQL